MEKKLLGVPEGVISPKLFAIFTTQRGAPHTITLHLSHTLSSAHRKQVLTKLLNSQLVALEYLVGIRPRGVSLISLSSTQVGR